MKELIERCATVAGWEFSRYGDWLTRAPNGFAVYMVDTYGELTPAGTLFLIRALVHEGYFPVEGVFDRDGVDVFCFWYQRLGGPDGGNYRTTFEEATMFYYLAAFEPATGETK